MRVSTESPELEAGAVPLPPDIAGLSAESKPVVREAVADDLPYVLEAFRKSLSPFYGGDHEAHARRLVETHVSGGADTRGLLSRKQLLLILQRGQDRLGVLNLVFKRQATCKISPLILHPQDHRNQGLGVLLLTAAEKAARAAGARQMYCTVAKNNADALAFFQQFGFVTCGESEDQYKDGQVEVLLRRPLPDLVPDDGPSATISVAEVRDEHEWPPVRSILVDALRTQVDGVDPAWLDSLWAGTPTVTNCPDHSEATTWVFGAKDRLDRYRAGAVGTCKKGESVKIMPISAPDIEGFRAMVADLPLLLADKGRKAYLHIAADPDQVAVLQECGWHFEALLPGAYSDSVVTQQWGCPLGEDGAVTQLRISRKYFELIRSGRKTLEIRVGYKHIKRIRPGDELGLMNGPDSLLCHVEDVRTYRDFAELLAHEDVNRALPGLSEDEALTQLRRIYPSNKERLGVYVLELKAPTV
jgi:ASC-1-like (ASCH) protein/GNAT superfamily N-acetyltransferase